MILNEETRAEMTQHHSLEPQVHRPNKGWLEAFPWVFLPFFCFVLFLRSVKTETSTCEKKNCLQKQRRHFLR